MANIPELGLGEFNNETVGHPEKAIADGECTRGREDDRIPCSGRGAHSLEAGDDVTRAERGMGGATFEGTDI